MREEPCKFMVEEPTLREAVTADLDRRMLRQSTVFSYLQTLRQLGLEDLPTSALTPRLLFDALTRVTTPNTRRKHVVALRSMFREQAWIREFGIDPSVPRIYDLPSETDIRLALVLCRYEVQGLLMMYAGLRCGEATAASVTDLDGNILRVFRQQDLYGQIRQAKTVGSVVVPNWLAERLSHVGGPRPTNGAVREAMRRSGLKVGIHLAPHMLRHWYATQLVSNGVNPEIARRQMRHSDLKTTLGYYAQVSKNELAGVVEDLFGQASGRPGMPSNYKRY